jgi:hypothetical protein
MMLVDLSVKMQLNISYILWLQPLYFSYFTQTIASQCRKNPPENHRTGLDPGPECEWLSPYPSQG